MHQEFQSGSPALPKRSSALLSPAFVQNDIFSELNCALLMSFHLRFDTIFWDKLNVQFCKKKIRKFYQKWLKYLSKNLKKAKIGEEPNLPIMIKVSKEWAKWFNMAQNGPKGPKLS